MKRKNSTRNALVTSVISLLLCVSMLVGTTFAWFTDSVTSSGNIIKSGNLDVEMYWADGTENPDEVTWKDASEGAIFNYDLWEPGYTQVRHIKIENKGSLALKYQLKIVANGEVSNLADVIDVYYADPATPVANRAALANVEKLGTLTEALGGMATSANGALDAGEIVTVTLALKMQETAGNDYMDKAIGSDFSIILLATQETAETDSFDDQYDVNATYPSYATGTGSLADNATEVVIEAKAEGEATPVATVTIPAAALENPTVPSQVIVIPTVQDNSVTVKTSETAQTFDVSVTNIKENNVEQIKVELNVGEGLEITAVYHHDEPIESYTYENGIVSFYTTSFSPFTVVFKDNTIQATDAPGADVSVVEPGTVNATLGMGGAASEYKLNAQFLFKTTETSEEAAAGAYGKYHADFVVKVDKEIARNAAALVGYYEAYCKDYNNDNWVALQSDDVIPANTEIRLLEMMLNGGSMNYEELCKWVPEFKCGVADLSDGGNAGTTLTVELRLYETKAASETESNTSNEETGNYITIGTYTYTFE